MEKELHTALLASKSFCTSSKIARRSFLEIESDTLFDLGFDINNHTISNLFTKYNKNLGKMEYCYSVNYKR